MRHSQNSIPIFSTRLPFIFARSVSAARMLERRENALPLQRPPSLLLPLPMSLLYPCPYLDDMSRLALCKLRFSAARFALPCAAMAIVAQGKWVRTALILERGGFLFAGALCD